MQNKFTGRTAVALLLLSNLLLVGCVSHQTAPDGTAVIDQDPYESFNRKVFAFNDGLDRYLLKPAAKGYKAVSPQPVERGVINFFSNLGEVTHVVNDVLQWKWHQAGVDSSRFLINSTIGVVGIFDVATSMGIEEADGEDFGQTLSAWGFGQGAYIVLPFFGPSTTRDALAMPVNRLTNPVTYVDDESTRWTLTALDIINTRAQLLDTEELISGDRYLFIRDAYLQRRDYLINDGEVEDSFGSESDEFDSEF